MEIFNINYENYNNEFKMRQLINYFIKAFGHVNDESIKKINGNLKIKSYKKGAMIFNQGEIPNKMFFLIDGIAIGSLSSLDDEITEIPTIIFTPGRWVGAEYLCEKVPLSLNIVAEEESEIAFIEFHVIREIAAKNSEFSLNFAMAMSKSTAHRNYISLRRLYGNSNCRIFYTLTSLFEMSISTLTYNNISMNDAILQGVEIKISQQSLAKISSAGRTSVSKLLKKLEDQNFLRVGYSTIKFIKVENWKILSHLSIREKSWHNNLSVFSLIDKLDRAK